MNRRPKLSLVSNIEQNKKQALGLEAAKQTGTKPSHEFEAKGSGYTEEMPPPKPVRSEQMPARKRRDSEPKNSGWPNGSQLAKAVVVAVTVALSLYLLKRRFF